MSAIERACEEFMKHALDRNLRGNISETAANPMAFIFVGDRAAKKKDVIEKYLKKRWINTRGIVYENFGGSQSWLYKDITEKSINRADIVNYICENKDVRREFNDYTFGIMERISQSAGFERMDMAWVFIVTYSDEVCNAVIPELVMLLKKQFSSMNISPFLFVNFEENQRTSKNSIAFLQEMNRFQAGDFNYSAKIADFGGSEFVLAQKNEIFKEVFMLELYRRDDHFNKNDEYYNSIVIALIMYLLNSGYQLPQHFDGKYMTAGYSSAERPDKVLAMEILSDLFDVVLGLDNSNADAKADEVFAAFSKEQIEQICENIMQNVPGIDCIASVMPMDNVSPEGIPNSNVGGILREFFRNNEDEAFYKEHIENFCINSLEGQKYSDIDSIVRELVNSRKLTFVEVSNMLRVNGELTERLKGMKIELNKDEELYKKDYENIENQIVTMPKAGLFGKKYNGCDLVAKAVEEKYSARLNITRTVIKKRILDRYINAITDLNQRLNRVCDILSVMSNEYRAATNNELIQTESTLIDAQPIKACYHNVIKQTLEAMRANGNYLFEDSDLYATLKGLTESTTEGLENEFIKAYQRVILQNPLSTIFDKVFDKELYFRYYNIENSTASRTPDEVKAELFHRLTTQSCENLRFNLFARTQYSKIFCLGNPNNEFIEYVQNHTDNQTGVTRENIRLTQNDTYEQITVTGNIAYDSITYINSHFDILESNPDYVDGYLINR